MKDDMQDQDTSFDLDAARKSLAKGKPYAFSNIDVVNCRIHGRDMCFAVDMENDPIQRNHRRGQFYEAKELGVLKRVLPLGGVFVDIGANVGNHSLYVAHFLSPAKIIPFEPNPLAYKLLLANVALNGFADLFDLRHVGQGLSDEAASGFAMEARERNLGGAKLLETGGTIEVTTGDAALARVTPNVIKIDVEGMELKVLKGLEATLDRARPHLLVEVDNENEAAFLEWASSAGYATADTFQRYRLNKNYLMRAKRNWSRDLPRQEMSG